MGQQRLDRADHVRQIGLAVGGEGRWDADDQRIGFDHARKVAAGDQPGGARRSDCRPLDMGDIALAPVELVNLGGVDVDPQDVKALGRIAQREWQPDVAKANDANYGVSRSRVSSCSR